jgi:hypothetical protein
VKQQNVTMTGKIDLGSNPVVFNIPIKKNALSFTISSDLLLLLLLSEMCTCLRFSSSSSNLAGETTKRYNDRKN